MDKITTIAIDLSKRDFQVVTEGRNGAEISSPRFRSRDTFAAYVETLTPPLRVGMESGPGAQAWARALQARGLEVRILPAQRVAEHRSGAKNDRNDARAILRALRDRSIHPVPIKTPEQLAMQALHRARSGWVGRRTALSNQIRGLLLDHAVAIAQGDAALERALTDVLGSNRLAIPERLREIVAWLEVEWRQQGERIEMVTGELKRLVREDPVARLLDTIDGIGPITATALACKGIDPGRYRNSRLFAASFGVVPEQHSTAGKTRLGRMSRRGDSYIRMLLIQGAHAALRVVRAEAKDPYSRRLRRWREVRGSKGAAVRLANHNLRVVWVLLKRQVAYQRNPTRAQPASAPMEA